MPRQECKTDRRLLGTWRSDRRRTFKDWIWPPRTSAKARKRLSKQLSTIFGHLVLRYTRTRAHADFKGTTSSHKYEILGVDSNSVAIMTWDTVLDEESIYHIHFEGDRHYWITLGRQREWFRRVDPS